MMDTFFVIVALGLGLVGAFTPCALGINALFLAALRERPRPARLVQASIFTLTRALFIASVGLLFAGLVRQMGVFTVHYQQAVDVLLILFGVLFILYLYYPLSLPWITLGTRLSQTRAGSLGLGILFGLDIPACASPLFYAVLSRTVFVGDLLTGAAALVAFGLGMSLPALSLTAFDGLNARLSAFARRRRAAFTWLGGGLLIAAGLIELIPLTMTPFMGSADVVARRTLASPLGVGLLGGAELIFLVVLAGWFLFRRRHRVIQSANIQRRKI